MTTAFWNVFGCQHPSDIAGAGKPLGNMSQDDLSSRTSRVRRKPLVNRKMPITWTMSSHTKNKDTRIWDTLKAIALRRVFGRLLKPSVKTLEAADSSPELPSSLIWRLVWHETRSMRRKDVGVNNAEAVDEKHEHRNRNKSAPEVGALGQHHRCVPD